MSSNEEVPETEVRSGINMTILFYCAQTKTRSGKSFSRFELAARNLRSLSQNRCSTTGLMSRLHPSNNLFVGGSRLPGDA